MLQTEMVKLGLSTVKKSGILDRLFGKKKGTDNLDIFAINLRFDELTDEIRAMKRIVAHHKARLSEEGKKWEFMERRIQEVADQLIEEFK